MIVPSSHRRLTSLLQRALLAGLIGAIVWFYGWTVTSNSTGRQPLFGEKQRDYNNLLMHAFLGGHLYLPIAPDPRLLHAEDPYNPEKRGGAIAFGSCHPTNYRSRAAADLPRIRP